MISPVRRTTIVVSDIDQSLSFYQDLLGMQVFYDQEIQAEASAKLMGVPDCRVRLVSLQSDDSANGMVGLLTFLSPQIQPRADIQKQLFDPDAALLFMADDIDIQTTFKRLQESGVEIVCPPLEYEVPERGPLSGFTCKDPDGLLVALMRFGSLQQTAGHVKASPTRRTTIVVGDMDASLEFYCGTLGLTVFYDQEIASEEEGRLLGIPGARLRIVSLQSGTADEGMVGLMQFLSPDINPRAQVRQAVANPDLFLIFLTDDIQGVHARMLQTGADVKCPPIEYEIPGRGTSAGLTCYDPDGVLIEFTQFGPLNSQIS